MKSTKAALMMSLVLVSAYAEEADKKTQEALSAPTDIMSLRPTLMETPAHKVMRIIRRRRSLLPSHPRAEESQ